MDIKFIIVSIIGVIALNLIISYIIQKKSQDKKLLDYLKRTSKM